MNCQKLQKKVQRVYGRGIHIKEREGNMVLSGTLDSWEDIVNACTMCVDKKRRYHVINDLKLKDTEMPKMRVPKIRDQALDGRKPDVLIIGGGISGTSIARELMKWKLDVLLVDKEADVAMHASGRNDGEVHPGINLGKGTLKQHYVVRGNRMYGKICRQLDVPFKRCGQYVGMMHWRELLPVCLYAWQRKHLCGVSDTRVILGSVLRRREPHMNKDMKFALYNSSAGSVCPYGLTIAYAENAVQNGAGIALNTAVLSMEVEQGEIRSVLTNRGRIYPKIVINAAGVFAEDVAKMAKDRFYSIHPRRGTNAIQDKKAGNLLGGIASWKSLGKAAGHTKGGGIVHTVHDNLLVGPDAVETYEKENFATEILPGCYTPEVEIFRGYWLISWFKNEFAQKEVAEAIRLKVQPEEILNKRLKEVPAGCDGLIMQPYFTPNLTMPEAKGAVIGFSDVHTRIHLYRAIIEGINFALMDGMHHMEKRGGFRFEEIRVGGGGAQSSEICQITADMFGIPVVRTQTYEVSGIGSAIPAFVTLGVFGSYKEALRHMVHRKDVFYPDKEQNKVYWKLYEEVYKQIYPRLSEIYEKIGEI